VSPGVSDVVVVDEARGEGQQTQRAYCSHGDWRSRGVRASRPLWGVAASDVAEAHMKDLQEQAKHDVNYKSYWVDTESTI